MMSRLVADDLTIQEAAKYLRISVRYLLKISGDRLDATNGVKIRRVKEGKRTFFPLEELERYRESRKNEQWGER